MFACFQVLTIWSLIVMPQVHHMVLLKFKQDVNDGTIADVLQAVEELKQPKTLIDVDGNRIESWFSPHTVLISLRELVYSAKLNDIETNSCR
jgi:hypothetical protein